METSRRNKALPLHRTLIVLSGACFHKYHISISARSEKLILNFTLPGSNLPRNSKALPIAVWLFLPQDEVQHPGRAERVQGVHVVGDQDIRPAGHRHVQLRLDQFTGPGRGHAQALWSVYKSLVLMSPDRIQYRPLTGE